MILEITASVKLDTFERIDEKMVKKEIETIESILGYQFQAKITEITRVKYIFVDIPFDEFYSKTKDEIINKLNNLKV